MLKEKIAAVESQMRGKLDELRTTFTQSGDKGTSLEDTFRRFLREYLPRRLEVGVGEIIDSKGHRSNQTDIVIVNEDHPLTFTRDLPGLFFIEGVCAAGEVRSVLTSEGLGEVIKNSFNFKHLETVLSTGSQVCANPSDLKRYYKCPPYFLIAFNSQLELSSILERIESFLKDQKLTVSEINTILDAVFVIDKGWIINFGDGQGCFQFMTSEGVPVKGWAYKPSKTVLFDLLSWLSAVMPRIDRFEPILTLYMLPHKIA